MKGFEPMMCKSMDVVPEDDAFILEPKLDGWRAVAGIPTEGERAWLETRANNRITSVPYIAEALAASFPAGTVVDGEIVDAAGTRWNRVQTICSRDAEHVPSEESPALTFVLFDLLVVKGHDIRHLPLADRRDILADVPLAEPLRLIDWLEPKEEVLADLIERGFEGAVVKRKDAVYRSGKRDGAFIKVKPQTLDDDAVIIGFYEPEAGSKYDGVAVGGIEFLRANGYKGRAAGMDDETRKRMLTNPEDFIGKVVELGHHGEFSDSGALRHPNFKRLRPDRSARDVLVDQPMPKELPPEFCTQKPSKPEARRGTPRSTPRPAPKKVKPPAPGGSGRRRNYAAMGVAKLTASQRDLANGYGEHYDRCIHDGSADPDGDLAYVNQLMADRGFATVR